MSYERGDRVHNAGFEVRRFKLKTAHAAGGDTTAYLVLWRNGTQTVTTKEFTVTDPFSIFDGDVDGYGYAIYMPDSAKWEIIQLQCPA